jgi:hypothetical protein
VKRLKTIAIVIAGLALFGFVVFHIGVASEHQKNKSPPREYRGEQAQEEQAKSKSRAETMAVHIECEPNCTAKAPENNGNEFSVYGLINDLFQKLIHDPVAFFTGLLFIATVLLAVIAGNQVKDSRAIQRAHVFVHAPQSEFLRDTAERIVGLRFWVNWKNSGTTPASPVVALIGATWVPSIDQFDFGDVSQGGVQQPFVLGPGAELASGTIDISPQHLLATLNGQGALLLWGWARYRDIFPRSREHVVEFCFGVTIDGQLGPLPFTGRVNFGFHGEHNRYYDA